MNTAAINPFEVSVALYTFTFPVISWRKARAAGGPPGATLYISRK